METLLHTFQKKVTESITKAFGSSLSEKEGLADIAPCSQKEHGHYQCNSALKLSKLLKQNPRQVAEAILAHFDQSLCSKVEVAGPGFINFTLSSKFLSEKLLEQFEDPYLGGWRPGKRQKIIVEFSSPNIAKELHVGHIRSTIIGDCLARFFEFLDQDVLRLNHLGDWGTQFGMLIAYMKKHYLDVLLGKKRAHLNSLMDWYKKAKKCFDEEPLFKKEAQEEVVKLQSGDVESLQFWKLICDVSRKGFQEIYDLLGVHLIERGESFYNPMLKSVVEDLEKRDLITLSDGAKCIYLEGFKNRDGDPLPLMVQKSDGGYNYDTTDLAALKQRLFEENADRIIVVVDLGQSLHFQMVFAAAQKAGWYRPSEKEVAHVGFGLVLGPDGKKFKTRSGETEKLIDLLKGGVQKAKEILLERDPQMDPKELDHLSKVLGINAIKYADLSSLRTKDYVFSYDKMLKFEGNTATFLLYSYVRVNGIKRKLGSEVHEILKRAKMEVAHPAEIALGVHLLRFGEVTEMIARDLLPNRLTDYLYELAEKFNAFFRDCKVVGSEFQESRLVLSELTSNVLRKGLEILGLKTVEKM